MAISPAAESVVAMPLSIERRLLLIRISVIFLSFHWLRARLSKIPSAHAPSALRNPRQQTGVFLATRSEFPDPAISEAVALRADAVSSLSQEGYRASQIGRAHV